MASKALAPASGAGEDMRTDKRAMEDDNIVGLYIQRSESAIEATQAKYGKLCYSVAYGVLGNNEDAEECVNDTYVRTWNSIPPDMPSHLGAYVSKIARRLAIDRWRQKHAAKRSSPTAEIFDELEGALPDVSSSGEEMADRIVLRDTMNRFVTSLTPENRLVFMRRYWYCDSVKDIASMMHTTELVVKTRLSRMRKKLKKILEEEGVDA